MAKVEFNPVVKWITGKIGKLVYRRAYNGKVSAYPSPDISQMKWSPGQKAQHWKMKEAAIRDPQIRAYHLRMAREVKNDNRPYDMAVHDYFQGNNLFLQRKETVTACEKERIQDSET